MNIAAKVEKKLSKYIFLSTVTRNFKKKKEENLCKLKIIIDN